MAPGGLGKPRGVFAIKILRFAPSFITDAAGQRNAASLHSAGCTLEMHSGGVCANTKKREVLAGHLPGCKPAPARQGTRPRCRLPGKVAAVTVFPPPAGAQTLISVVVLPPSSCPID